MVQLYVRDLVSSVTRPVRELKGFRRVHLAPGERVTVGLPVGRDALAFHGVDRRYVVEPGDFELMIGTSSRLDDLQTLNLRVR